MKLFVATLLLTSILLSACGGKKNTVVKKNEPVSAGPVADIDTVIAPTAAEDSAAIRQVVVDFYNWYNKNYRVFDTYHLYEGIKKKGQPPFRIVWKEVDKYHQYIRLNVPQLGEEFISAQKQFFKECDSAFKVNREDEIPYGFDYDWYTNSQEDPAYLVKEVNKKRPWPMKWQGDYVTVAVKGSYDNNGKKEEAVFVTLTLKKESDEWKIVKIGTDEI